MIPSEFGVALVNHLWQSTVVVAIAWLLAWALRKNHARVRYWVWFAASMKFLLPFSLLMTAGEWLRSFFATPIIAKPALANAMEQIAQPFPQPQFFDAAQAPVTAHHGDLLSAVLLAIWICGVVVVAVRFGRGWLRVYAAKRAARPLALAADVPVLCSSSLIEPGIFGIFRPVLLLPEGILDRLAPEQLRAIVAHEMCHVRRRDNLTFAMHMIVEAQFWFHPAVWWIGARLIEERERACDEAVLQSGSEAEDYAEGILNVCKFYMESPLECVAGVTGSDLKQRIVRIMTERVAFRLTWSKKSLLITAILLAVAVPVVLGLGQNGQQFEVAAIKPGTPRQGFESWTGVTGGQYRMMNVPLKQWVKMGLSVRDYALVAPPWLDSSRFDLDAKLPAGKPVGLEALPEMIKALLIERFGLKWHEELRTVSGYELVADKKVLLKPASLVERLQGQGRSSGPTLIGGTNMPMSEFAGALGEALGRPVTDATHLSGGYDIRLMWRPVDDAEAAREKQYGVDVDNLPTSISTAVREQLGLRLQDAKVQSKVIVVDNINRQPTAN